MTDRIVDSHDLVVSLSNGTVVAMSNDRPFGRVSHGEAFWEDIPATDRTPMALYGLDDSDLARMGAETLRDALENDPVGTMRALGLVVGIPTMAE